MTAEVMLQSLLTAGSVFVLTVTSPRQWNASVFLANKLKGETEV